MMVWKIDNNGFLYEDLEEESPQITKTFLPQPRKKV